MPKKPDWKFTEGQKRHTQDGSQLVMLMKSVGLGRIPVLAADVGCGDGIIAWDMLHHRKATQVIAFDILKEAVAAAQANLEEEMNTGRAMVERISARAFFRKKIYWEAFDRFVINPPFFPSGSGISNKRERDQIARHESELSIKVWTRGARRLLKTGGELYCVFPTERLAELLSALTHNGVEPKEIWWLKHDRRHRRFFLRAIRGAKPGLVVHTDFDL